MFYLGFAKGAPCNALPARFPRCRFGGRSWPLGLTTGLASAGAPGIHLCVQYGHMFRIIGLLIHMMQIPCLAPSNEVLLLSGLNGCCQGSLWPCAEGGQTFVERCLSNQLLRDQMHPVGQVMDGELSKHYAALWPQAVPCVTFRQPIRKRALQRIWGARPFARCHVG